MPDTLTYLIVHGAKGNPAGNWFPWLKTDLEKSGGIVFLPAFPTPTGQSRSAWLQIADRALQNSDPATTVLIGHSTGALLVLHLAAQAQTPFKAVFAICPFFEKLGLPDYDSLNASFIAPEPDWAAVRRNGGKIWCLVGDDDPYVPVSVARSVADNAQAELLVVEKGGHLNAEAGFTEFPLLLDAIGQTIR